MPSATAPHRPGHGFFSRTTFGGLVFAARALCAGLVFAVTSLLRFREGYEWVSSRHEIITQAEVLLRHVKDLRSMRRCGLEGPGRGGHGRSARRLEGQFEDGARAAPDCEPSLKLSREV